MRDLIPIACRFILSRGSLQTCDLADLLPVLFWNEKSGVIEIENVPEALDREILLENGLPVGVVSYRKNESLGHFLLEEGHLNEEQYKDLIDLMLDQSLSIHEALAKTTFLHPEELAMAAGLYQRRIMERVFFETHGEYRFHERALEAHEKPTAPVLSIGPIYAQNILNQLDKDFLNVFSDHSIVLHESFDPCMRSLGFSSDVLDRVLATPQDQLAPEDWAIILTALDFQLLTITFHGPANYHLVQKLKRFNASTELAAPHVRRSRVILMHWIKTFDQTDAQLLQVDATANAKALKAAYFKAVKVFHPDRFRGKVSEAVMDFCEHFFHRLTQASESLKSPPDAGRSVTPIKREPWRLAEAYGLLAGQEAMRKNMRGALLLADAATRCFGNEGRGPLMHALARYILASDVDRDGTREALKNDVAAFLSKHRHDLFWQAIAACLLVDEGQTQAGVRGLEVLIGDFPDDEFLLALLKSAVTSFTNPGLCVTQTFFLNPASH